MKRILQALFRTTHNAWNGGYPEAAAYWQARAEHAEAELHHVRMYLRNLQDDGRIKEAKPGTPQAPLRLQ